MISKFATAVMIMLFITVGIDAQRQSDDTDFESFNDLQLTAPMSRNVDFFTAVATRFAGNVHRFNDGRFALGVTWKPHKRLQVTPFYWNIQARNTAGSFRQEHRLNLRTVYRIDTPKFSLVHRSTGEIRLRNSGNTWRYRAALFLEKDVPPKFLKQSKLIIGDEVFYDSATGRFSRNRISLGVARQLTKKLGVELTFMHQNDGYAHPGDLNVVWLSWRVRL